jgi:DNA-binding NarL/FixJ family response regulator
MKKIRVLIVDDHEVFCESLAFLLSIRGEAEIVGRKSAAGRRTHGH